MRKLLWGFTVIITASIIILACQKENSSTNKNVYGIDAVKEWYYGTFKKSPEWAGHNSTLNKRKLPDWKHGVYKRFGDYEIVEFPLVKEKSTFSIAFKADLSENEKRKITNAAISRVIFVKEKSGTILVREMQYIPDIDYLAKHNFDISHNTTGKIDNDFSGTIVAKKWNGQEVSRSILKDGKIISMIRLNATQAKGGLMRTAACQDGDIEITEYARECESHLYGDGLFTYECGEWIPTGVVICIPGEQVDPNPECTNPGSVECYCQMIGGCDDSGGDDDEEEEGECNLSVEEADGLLAGISEGTNNDISYTDGSESLPDENEIIKKNKNPEVYGFYFIDYVGGGSTIWTANFTGIVFRHSTNQTWKWEQLGYNGFTKTGTHPICFTHSMQVNCGIPIKSSDKRIATLAANEFKWKLDILFDCLGGIRMRRTEGHNSTNWDFQAN